MVIIIMIVILMIIIKIIIKSQIIIDQQYNVKILYFLQKYSY